MRTQASEHVGMQVREYHLLVCVVWLAAKQASMSRKESRRGTVSRFEMQGFGGCMNIIQWDVTQQIPYAASCNTV